MDIKKTRAGLTPNSTSEVPYTITTAIAEEYLQKMFDTVNVGARAKNKDPNGYPDFNVSLMTLNCSKKFKPMMVILPMSVLKNQESKKSEREPSIFSTSDGNETVYIQKHIFTVLQPFLYDKKDAEAFGSNAVRRALGLQSKIYYSIKANRLPRIQKFNRGQSEFVVVMIDPVRLFHHMLESPDSSERFEVEIGNTEQVKATNYRYEVFKVFKTGKNKKKKRSEDDRIAYEIQQRFAGFGGGR